MFHLKTINSNLVKILLLLLVISMASPVQARWRSQAPESNSGPNILPILLLVGAVTGVVIYSKKNKGDQSGASNISSNTNYYGVHRIENKAYSVRPTFNFRNTVGAVRGNESVNIIEFGVSYDF